MSKIKKDECWLCVNFDGTEQIRDRKPKRYYGTESEKKSEILCFDDFTKKNIWISDYDYISDNDFPSQGTTTVVFNLPKGTIEKILGYPLTWNDEAVQLLN